MTRISHVRPIGTGRRRLLALAAVFAVAAAAAAGVSFRQSGDARAQAGEHTVRVCKQYFNTGSSNNFGVPFGFLVEATLPGEDSPAVTHDVELVLHEGNQECSDALAIPADATVRITETLPNGWANTPTYPRWSANAGGVQSPESEGEVATFINDDSCQGDTCFVLFKNRQDETGQGITPPAGDPLSGSLRVCKDFRDNGDGVQITGRQFTFNFGTFDFPIGPFMNEGDLGCSGFSLSGIFPGESMTVRELEPVDFLNVPGFPTVKLEGDNAIAEHSADEITFFPSACGIDETPETIPPFPEFEGPIAQSFDCTVTFANQAPAEGVEAPEVPEQPEVPEPGVPGEDEEAVEGEVPEDTAPVIGLPPCQDCTQPTPIGTEPAPATPTATPTLPQPTATQPAPGSTVAPATPSPVSTVGGERTPGAQVTPVAPSTGTGPARGTDSSLLLAGGLAAIALACAMGAFETRARS